MTLSFLVQKKKKKNFKSCDLWSSFLFILHKNFIDFEADIRSKANHRMHARNGCQSHIYKGTYIYISELHWFVMQMLNVLLPTTHFLYRMKIVWRPLTPSKHKRATSSLKQLEIVINTGKPCVYFQEQRKSFFILFNQEYLIWRVVFFMPVSVEKPHRISLYRISILVSVPTVVSMGSVLDIENGVSKARLTESRVLWLWLRHAALQIIS